MLSEIILLGAMALFCRGFLPPTLMETGFSDEVVVSPKFNRLVFVIIDALRSDFMFDESSKMDFIHSMISQGFGLPFTARSDPPTVTLPRLKGLTTGAAPNFLDAVVNIAESDTSNVLAEQDSWVEQALRHNKTLHMFGDDTWLRLFPNAFASYEGTSSFYVADYTEVDNNVTRHLDYELTHQEEWDILVLHYLGLDHIGHKGGPQSPLMGPKQREMDDVIRRIWSHLDEDTLLVVAGDHGMNDVGNHGGASAGETSAALFIGSPAFRFDGLESPVAQDNFDYHCNVQQVDIVTTLAMFMGTAIPKNSLGVFLPQFLTLWSPEERLKILSANARRLQTQNITIDALRDKQADLMRSTSAHVLPLMEGGVAVMLFVAATSLFRVQRIRQYGALLMGVLYFAAMMASSTVEEEHYLWFWLTPALEWVSDSDRSLLAAVVQVSCLRLARGWHGMGDKWASFKGTSEWLSSRPEMMWMVLLAYAMTWAWRQRVSAYAWPAALAFLQFKLVASARAGDWVPLEGFESAGTLWPARIAFGAALINWLASRDLNAFELILAIQSRSENVFLFSIYALARRFTTSSTTPLLSLCWQYASFFAAGGSNSMATLDLSQAYNGVSDYNIPVVFLMGYLSNWAGPIYWAFVRPAKPALLVSWFYSAAAVGVCAACLMLREHLFIWTVFSPKLLYMIAWLAHHLVTSIIASFCI